MKKRCHKKNKIERKNIISFSLNITNIMTITNTTANSTVTLIIMLTLLNQEEIISKLMTRYTIIPEIIKKRDMEERII